MSYFQKLVKLSKAMFDASHIAKKSLEKKIGLVETLTSHKEIQAFHLLDEMVWK